jgi:D-arabinose 1-dehydrogenase-like Zn-dependent alcohol dehydrogenase
MPRPEQDLHLQDKGEPPSDTFLTCTHLCTACIDISEQVCDNQNGMSNQKLELFAQQMVIRLKSVKRRKKHLLQQQNKFN